MGDRALVIFKDKHSVSPTVYLHWAGESVPHYIQELAKLMYDRHGDAAYACARFMGIIHADTPGSSSLGCWNTDMEQYNNADWKEMSHGDAGVVIVNTDDFSWEAHAGYLAKPQEDNE